MELLALDNELFLAPPLEDKLIRSEQVVREKDRDIREQELSKQTPSKQTEEQSELNSTAQSFPIKPLKNKHMPKQDAKSNIYAEDIKDALNREKEKIRKRNAKIREQKKKQVPLTLEEKLDEKFK